MALFPDGHLARPRREQDWRFPLPPFHGSPKDQPPRFLRKPAQRVALLVRQPRRLLSGFPRSTSGAAPHRHTGRNRPDKGWRHLARLELSMLSLFQCRPPEPSLATDRHTKSLAAGSLGQV